MTQGFSKEPGTHGPMAGAHAEGLKKSRRWAVVIALGGFLFGYDTGVVSGALLFITRDFDLNSLQQGSVVSVLLLGTLVGAPTAGWLEQRIGRRAALRLEAVVFAVGTVVAILAPGYGMLLAGRFILGLAVGSASATVPVYLSEVSPKEIRGSNLTLNQLMIVIGILVSYLIDLAFATNGSWRWMFGIGLVPSLLLAAGTFWLPESPSWLFAQGRVDAARKLIASVLGETEADRVIDRFRSEDSGQDKDSVEQSKGWRVLAAPGVRPALIVGLTLAVVQQFGGINTIVYYAPTIMKETGLSASNAIFYSVFIGVINLIMTLVAIRLIERAGRRMLLLISLTGMTVMMALLGLAFVVELSPVATLLFMVLYIASFAVGMGPVFWVLIGELFPPAARAAGSSVSTTANWASNFVVGLVFLPVASAIGQGQTFWIFAAVCAFALWFVARYVPETKGRDFGEVDAALKARFGRPAPGGTAQ